MKLVASVLETSQVRLEPLAERHGAPLRAAADDAAIWTHMPWRADGDHFDAWRARVSERHASGDWLYFVAHRPDGGVVGASGYCAVDPPNAMAEIGATWYVRDAQGTAVNPACKLLLLGHAFACGAERVEFKTDARNARSRAAIAKLGATFEGILRRRHRTQGGRLRDTAYFSILAEEWPAVKAGLTARLKG